MRSTWKVMPLVSILLLGVLRLGPDLADAQEESKPAKSVRGGIWTKTARHQFEVFFYTAGVRVFPLDLAGAPIDASRLNGTATFYHPNSPTPWFSRPLHSAATNPGQGSASLEVGIGLSRVPPMGVKVTFKIVGLPDPAESTATFTVPFEFVTTPAESPAAHLAPPPGGGAPSPRYVYGPGYYGYGYYEDTSPAPRPRPAGPHNYATTPGMFGPGGMKVGPYHRDWTTGRSSPLAKPWLRPMD